MKFKVFAGTSLVPTLSRLVLALAFVTAGYQKLSGEHVFGPDQAAVLEELGVTTTPTAVAAVGSGPAGIIPVGFRQDEGQDEGDADDKGADDAKLVIPESDLRAPRTTDGSVTARAMHVVTILCHEKGWPMPAYMALLCALTELIGGALVLVGFLSRVWGLGLAVTMGVAIYMTTWQPYFDAGPLVVAAGETDGHMLYNAIFSQLGLFVLSFGLLLTGPGPLSLDRLLFKPRAAETVDEEFSVPDATPAAVVGTESDPADTDDPSSTGVRPL